jgi:Ca-activated chloride channel family protein
MMNGGRSAEGIGDKEGMLLGVGAERRLLNSVKSASHIDLTVRAPFARAENGRPPLALSLVVDRSGSMQGVKLDTAKRAALAVLDRLSREDVASVVVFDSSIDVILPEGPMSGERKALARSILSQVEARSQTALHEGWLTGCRSIAADVSQGRTPTRLSRCFLLTDGLANVGMTDPEQVAAQAADVRQNSGICTSTFGIGEDYDEGLLAPMAVAGNGQFHHLRDQADIAATFAGELSEMFEVTARAVRIEIKADPSVHPELVSLYWGARGGGPGALRIEMGDMIGGEMRHIVVHLTFGWVPIGARVPVHARVVWRDGQHHREGSWQELDFVGADDAACAEEPRDMAVMHWVGLHHADKARAEALLLHRKGDTSGAIHVLDGVMRRLGGYAAADPDLVRALKELGDLRERFATDSLSQSMAKEMSYTSHLNSRMQRDLRH